MKHADVSPNAAGLPAVGITSAIRVEQHLATA